jgi:hypothetical protein
MIKPCVAGFEVFDGNGESVGKVLSFAEALELQAGVKDREVEPVELDKIEIGSGPRRTTIYTPAVDISQSSSTSAICAKRPWRSMTMALENPAQIKEFNEAAQKFAGPGVRYEMDKGEAVLVCDSKSARNRALRWLNKIDRDAGYGDHTGR